MTFDPKRRLVMATAKTVLGHALPVGHPLTIVEEPSAAGEVDEAMAKRLQASKLAGYLDELHATPVETPEQERNRLALEAVRESRRPGVAEDEVVELTPTPDLLVNPAGHPNAGKKVTKDDLIEIAGKEGVVIETDDNKPDLVRKIMEARALRATPNGTEASSEGASFVEGSDVSGATGRATGGRADSGAQGDAHGKAGEGPSDAE